jgi:hypothetical protein
VAVRPGACLPPTSTGLLSIVRDRKIRCRRPFAGVASTLDIGYVVPESVHSGKIGLRNWNGHSCAWSSDGQVLAVSGRGELRLWRVRNGGRSRSTWAGQRVVRPTGVFPRRVSSGRGVRSDRPAVEPGRGPSRSEPPGTPGQGLQCRLHARRPYAGHRQRGRSGDVVPDRPRREMLSLYAVPRGGPSRRSRSAPTAACSQLPVRRPTRGALWRVTGW